MSKVTLLTASFNSAATIGDTLRSVAAQTYPNIEHIVVDGGSKDDTMAVVAREGAHLAMAVSERDSGIYDAYNKGLGLATGDVIGFINSDDFYAREGVIARVMDAFADPEIEAVHADLVYVRQDDTSKATRYWKSRSCSRSVVRRGFHPAHPTLFLRRSVYDRVGVFDQSYRIASDVEFMNRVFYRFGVNARYIPEIWVRMREGGATGGNFASIKRQNAEVRRGQAANGIDYPESLYWALKLIDRATQKVRAPFVNLSPPAWAS